MPGTTKFTDEEIKYYSVSDIIVLPYTDIYQNGVIQLTYGYSKPMAATSFTVFTHFVAERIFFAELVNCDSFRDVVLIVVANRDFLKTIGRNENALLKEHLDWNI